MKTLTVSLELAKKMKELWWNKDDQFTYFYYDWKEQVNMDDINERWDDFADYLCAPTAQEILDELPFKIRDGLLTVQRIGRGECHQLAIWYFQTVSGIQMITSKAFCSKNLAEALWQLWCWRNENWYLK